MPYWEITPHQNTDYESCILPGETEENHQAALTYAKERLESLWDSLAHFDGPRTVTIELHKGPMPDFDDEA
jgi:hypothetical protein